MNGVQSGRIKVAFCIDSFDIGGTELNAVRTAEALDRDRFELAVFHLHDGGPLKARYEALGIRMFHVPIKNLYSLSTARQGQRFGRQLRDWGAQVVHTHDLYTNIFAVPSARIFGAGKIIASRRWWFDAPRAGLTLLNRLSYRFAHRVLANSKGVARLLRETEKIPARKVVEIPNFLEERAFAAPDPAAVAEQRRQWGLPADAFVVGIVARLAPVKNQAMLINALAKLDKQVHLVLIGDGPSRQSLADLADGLGIGARVHFAGEIHGHKNLHQNFDVSVLCSLSEGFPNSVIEALAAARPVVATSVGGVTDIIDDNRTGLLVPSEDSQALAAALQKLQHDAPLRQQLAAAGLQSVRAQFHQDVVMDSLAELYHGLAA